MIPDKCFDRCLSPFVVVSQCCDWTDRAAQSLVVLDANHWDCILEPIGKLLD